MRQAGVCRSTGSPRAPLPSTMASIGCRSERRCRFYGVHAVVASQRSIPQPERQLGTEIPGETERKPIVTYALQGYAHY